MNVAKQMEMGEDVDREDVLSQVSILEAYSLNSHATAMILEDKDGRQGYYIDQPKLSEKEMSIRRTLTDELRQLLQGEDIEDNTPEVLAEKVEEVARERVDIHEPILSRYSRQLVDSVDKLFQTITSRDGRTIQSDILKPSYVDNAGVERIMYYLVRDFAQYGKLTPLMQDNNIEDISCSEPYNPVYVYHSGYENIPSNVVFGEDELDSMVSSLAERSGNQISIAYPRMQGRLPDGSRMQLTYGKEVSPSGSNFTIRLFSDEALTPSDLVNYGTFTARQMALIWFCVENLQSMLFIGDTASGKTTSLNSVSLFIPQKRKIVSVEDTREMVLSNQNWVKSVTREKTGRQSRTEINMFDLVKDGLRHRPDYFVVGEIRGEGAHALFQAMNSGHATYSTMHASSISKAAKRLNNEPINLPLTLLDSVDLVSLQLRRMTDEGTVRRSDVLGEVVGANYDNPDQPLQVRKIFDYKEADDEIVKETHSKIARTVAEERLGWDARRLDEDLQDRADVLTYLADEEGSRGYSEAATVFNNYMNNPERTMERMRNGQL